MKNYLFIYFNGELLIIKKRKLHFCDVRKVLSYSILIIKFNSN